MTGDAGSAGERAPLLLLALIGAAAAALGAIAPRLPPLDAVERGLGDRVLEVATPGLPPHERVAVAAITEDTLAAFPYRSPVERRFLAALVQRLDAAGVAAIGLDILFDQPTEPDADDRLATAIAGATAPVFASYATTADGLTPRQSAFLDGFLPAGRRGHARLAVDPVDGTVRRVAAVPDGPPRLPDRLAGVLGGDAARAGERILYRPTPGAGAPPFPVYPAHLVDRLPDAWLAGRIVLVGGVIDGVAVDRHPVPPAGRIGGAATLPGVMIHGQVVAQLLDGRHLAEPGAWVTALLAGLAALIGVAVAGSGLPAALRLGVPPLLALAYGAADVVLVQEASLLPPLLGPPIALLAAAGMAELRHGQRARAQRRFLGRAFARYLSPALLRDLLADPSTLRLGGARRPVTLLFTDLEGFTGLSETMPPESLVALLNRYLDGITGAVLAEGGTLDKYVGDAVVAIFGAPVPLPDHAARAVRAALAIDAVAEAFRRETGIGETRIGIHGGDAVVGNIGSDARFDYTALGDVVNVAARLESLNRHLGTRIAVSAETAAAAGADTRPVADVVVKGRAAAVRVVTPWDFPAAPGYRAAYDTAFASLAAGDAVSAGQAFAALAEACPDDPLVAWQRDRCRAGAADATLAMDRK